MADFNYQLGSSGKNTRAATWVGGIAAVLFATPFAAFGLLAIGAGIKKLPRGDTGQGVGILLFGSVFAAIGLGILYAAVTAGRRQRRAEAQWNAKTEGGTKNWLARDDWAAGKIKSSAAAQTRILFIFALAFGGFGTAMSFFVLPQEVHGGNYKALAIFLFPAIGLACGIAVLRSVLSRRRFGECWLELAQVPAPLGGALGGLIQTARPLHLEQGLHLKLSCLRRDVQRSGDGDNVSETVLWQNEKVLRPDAPLAPAGPAGTGIPVHFDIPAGQPEATLRGKSTIVWRLEAKAKMAGPDFHAVFEVPVFQVAGAPVAAEEPDPTAALQMPVDELRREENSRIAVTDGPGGREFYFPAARNIGVALSLLVPLLVFGGFTVAARRVFADLFFEIVFGLVTLVVFIGCFNLWLKSSRVTINASRLTRVNRWLLFARTRSFNAEDIDRFDTMIGMTSGNRAYYNLKLVLRPSGADFAAGKNRYASTGERPALKFKIGDRRGVTLASNIASQPEADWLAREMTRALGR